MPLTTKVLDGNISPVVWRLLLYMDINQSLQVRCGNDGSDGFSAHDCVQQGGV